MDKNIRIRLIGIIFIVAGILVTIFPYVEEKKTNKNELIEINKYLEETKIEEDEEINESLIEEDNLTVINEIKSNPEKEISMILEIPKIDFKRGLYNKKSKYNDVRYNIQILKESSMPGDEHGNVIIAGHNGNSKVAFFKKLKNLSVGDAIFIYYKGIKYLYMIDNIYLIDKDGMAEIYRDASKETITLITCNRKDRTKQEVYIGYLEGKEEY